MAQWRERIILSLLILGALAFNALPYVYEWRNSSPEHSYIGSYPVVFDKPTYLAEMRQGYEGGWRIINRYSHEPQQPVFLYSFYTTLGQVARIFNIPIETMFFAARFVFGLLLIFIIILTVRHFLSSPKQRLLAYIFIFFGSGLGWIPGVPLLSLDLWIPDFIPMVRFSYFPHMMAANALFLGIVMLCRQAFVSLSAKKIICAGLLSGLLAIILPFHLLLLYPLILTLYGLCAKAQHAILLRQILLLVLFFVLSLPFMMFQLSIGLFNPIWKAIEEANILQMPSPIALASGLGFLLIFFIAGTRAMLNENRGTGKIIMVWVWMAILFSYIIPIPIHRRFIETGLYVPLSIGASYGALLLFSSFTFSASSLFVSVRNIALIVIIAIGLFGTNFFNFSVFKATVNTKNDPRFVVKQSLVAGLKRLDAHSRKDEIIFSSFLVGNLIPVYASRTVYVGHRPSTIALEKKNLDTERFFNRALSEREARALLLSIPSRVVIESYIEREREKQPLEKAYQFLTPVFANDALTIYNVF